MTIREQTAYDLGFHEGRNAAVIHGRWTPNIVNNYGIKHTRGFNASCCGRWNHVKTAYCPNCGAKMDRGEMDA